LKPFTNAPATSPPPPALAAPPSLVKSPMPLRANLSSLPSDSVPSVRSVVKSLSSSLRISAHSAPQRYLVPSLLLASLLLCSLCGCSRPSQPSRPQVGSRNPLIRQQI